MSAPPRRRVPRGRVVTVAALALWMLASLAPGVHASPTKAEEAALDEARRHVAGGGHVDAALPDPTTLLSHPAMNVTRLHRAAERGWADVARYLLEQGAAPYAMADTKSRYNQISPMDLATVGKHAGVVAVLKRRVRPDVGITRRLVIDLSTMKNGLALIAFDENRWKVAYPASRGGTTCADVLLEPGDPELTAMTRTFDVFRHLGGDPALAPVGEGRLPPDHSVPAGATWGTSLRGDAVRPGSTFLVRTSIGTVFGVRVIGLDTRHGRLTLASTRLAARADPSESAPNPRPTSQLLALREAIRTGDTARMRAALDAGADPNATDSEGRTALHDAARRGRAELVPLLLKHAWQPPEPGAFPSADEYLESLTAMVSAKDHAGMTALHLAAYGGDAKVVAALLAADASAVETDSSHRTPLHYAALGNSLPVVEALLARGAPAHAEADDGLRPAALATNARVRSALRSAAEDSVRAAARGIGRLLARYLEAMRSGDAEAMRACLTPEGAAALRGAVRPIAFEAERERVRIGAREAEAAYVLTVTKETPLGRRFSLALELVDTDGRGSWRIARAAFRPR